MLAPLLGLTITSAELHYNLRYDGIMKSFEEQFYIENPTKLQALQRDALLLLWLLKRAFMWATKGVLIRLAYNKAKTTSTPLVIEDVIKD